VPGPSETDCFICRKHRGDEPAPGGPIYEDELVFASHGYHPERNPEPYLGHVVVEPKRHAPGLADLTNDEAAAVGVAVTRLARALIVSEGAEHVYSAVVGHHTPHLHVHLIPRYPGTPREYWDPFRVDEWPEAKHGGPDIAAEVAERIRARLELS
jgi:diadenosine tetraphosphate (Ap4A) HIT family hydrolase